MSELTAQPERTFEEEDRTIRILNSAETCFARKGFHGTSLSSIAAHAGVSKALILYHFESKDRLLFEVLERLLAETVAAVQVETADLPRGLEAGFKALDVMATALERWSPLMAGLAGALSDRGASIYARSQAFADGTLAIIESSMRETLGPDVDRLPIAPNRMASLLLSAVNGIILSANMGTGANASEQLDDLKAVLRAGIEGTTRGTTGARKNREELS